jgi:ferredoxin
MRVVVDTTICQGHARCEDVAPELFEVGDENDARAQVLLPEVPDDLRQAAEDAVFHCPMGAISLAD